MKILALAPHPDDIEIGCGATLNKLQKEGHEVTYVAFSKCEKSIDSHHDLIQELRNSVEVGGYKKLIILDFPVRDFPANRQKILEKLVDLKKTIDPDLVFTPASFDVHQDHKVIHEESIRAFKNHCSILGYELIWNEFGNDYRMYSRVNDEHVDVKMKQLECYVSQKGRTYFKEEHLKSTLGMRGVQAGHKYAECFEVIRYIF